MEKHQNAHTILKKLAPQLESTSIKFKVWIAFLLGCIALGLYALYAQVRYGHGVTGMRDHVVWGLYIANFIFFIGIGYSGAVIGGLLHLLKVPWRRPVLRLAKLMTVVCTIIGPVFILLCVGRLDRLHHLLFYPRLQSPITWDVVAIATYLVGGVLFLYLALIKDFAIYRDASFLKISAWKRKLYEVLSLGYKATPEQNRQISISTNLLALVMIPLAVVIASVLSWIFGMTLRPGWHSTIFGPYFVLGAIYSGAGVLIILMYAFRKLHHLEDHITKQHFVYMGLVMLVLATGYGYFTFSEYLTSWYGSEKWDGEVLAKLFALDEYGGWFIYANVVGVLPPIVVLAIRPLRKIRWITVAAVLIVSAMWVKRYLIVVPTLETPLLPVQDIRPEYVHYAASWVEWSLTLAGFATFLLFFSLAGKVITIIQVSDFLDRKEVKQMSENTGLQ